MQPQNGKHEAPRSVPWIALLAAFAAACGPSAPPGDADATDEAADTVEGVPTADGADHDPGPTSLAAALPDRPAPLPNEGPAVDPLPTDFEPTWATDVAPILYDACVTCHRPTGGAPFDLLTYEDARRRARQIEIVTESGYMPPWPAAPGDYAFLGERTLSAREKAVLARWAAGERPEGDPATAPSPPTFVAGWQMGEPDLVVSMPEPYQVPVEGTDVFRNFVLPVELEGEAWVQAVEIRPSNRIVVHHASMVADRSRTARQRDAAEPGIGFEGIETFIESDEPHGFFLNFKPGTIPNPGRPDMSWRVDGRTDLVLNLHMQPTGKPEELTVDVGLYFADAPPTRHSYVLRLNADDSLDIPPGEDAFVVTDEVVLPVDVQLFGVYPHMHYVGKIVEGYATLPDGTQKTLIHIPDWDFNWQAVYTFVEPIDLPAGTTLSMRYTYDNSADNPRNPSDPPIHVVSGNKSENEMAHLGLQVVPSTRAEIFEIQAAVMQTRIDKNPSNWNAHARLGDALRSLGRDEEARQQYVIAARGNPGDPLSRNNLAGVQLKLGKTDGALRTLRKLVADQPDYLNGRTNLAKLLIAQGAGTEAIPHLAHAHELDPENAEIAFDLGRVLAQAGRLPAARRALEAAVRADDRHVEAHFTLAGVLAASGEFEEAVALFERVLLLDPEHAGARQNLERARARLEEGAGG